MVIEIFCSDTDCLSNSTNIHKYWGGNAVWVRPLLARLWVGDQLNGWEGPVELFVVFHIPIWLELHSPRIVGRVRPLLVGSWVLVEASSGHRGKPRLPVSLSPPYRHRQPLQKLRICEIGREDFLPRKIRFLWSTNLIFRKFRAKKKINVGVRCALCEHKVSVKKCRSPPVRRTGQQEEWFLLIFDRTRTRRKTR